MIRKLGSMCSEGVNSMSVMREEFKEQGASCAMRGKTEARQRAVLMGSFALRGGARRSVRGACSGGIWDECEQQDRE